MTRNRKRKKKVTPSSSTPPVFSADVRQTHSVSPIAPTQSYFSYWGGLLSSTCSSALAYASSAAGSLTSLAIEQVTKQISRVAEVVSNYSSQSMANATEVTRYLLDPTIFPNDLKQRVDLSATLGTNKKEDPQVAVESVPRPLSAAEQGSHKTLASRQSSALPIKSVEASVLVVPQPQRTAPTIYELLGIDSTVKFFELKNVYHNAARQYHPRTVVGGAPKETEELWKQIQSLWSEVNSEEKKIVYDMQLQAKRIEGPQERLQITEGPIEQPKLAGANVIIEQKRPLPSPRVVEIAPPLDHKAQRANFKAQEAAARQNVVDAEGKARDSLKTSNQLPPMKKSNEPKPIQCKIEKRQPRKDPTHPASRVAPEIMIKLGALERAVSNIRIEFNNRIKEKSITGKLKWDPEDDVVFEKIIVAMTLSANLEQKVQAYKKSDSKDIKSFNQLICDCVKDLTNAQAILGKHRDANWFSKKILRPICDFFGSKTYSGVIVDRYRNYLMKLKNEEKPEVKSEVKSVDTTIPRV
jgi:hypothetical protein